MMIWMDMFSKGAFDHKSKQAVNQETYVTIVPNIIRMEMICFGQSTLLKSCSRMFESKKSPICFSC